MDAIRLFLCGDVMTGRGIDQIMRRPCDPGIHESYMPSALDYVLLAERKNGPIPRAVPPSYIWGDALAELERFSPDARVINLETAVTHARQWLPKGINYRMSLENVSCLTAARVDCCVLANKVRRAAKPDAEWLCAMLNRESSGAGVRARMGTDGCIEITWNEPRALARDAGRLTSGTT